MPTAICGNRKQRPYLHTAGVADRYMPRQSALTAATHGLLQSSNHLCNEQMLRLGNRCNAKL